MRTARTCSIVFTPHGANVKYTAHALHDEETLERTASCAAGSHEQHDHSGHDTSE